MVRASGCPCGNDAAYESCCGAFINGWASPETAVELMRSRYSAYVKGEIDYLVATHDPERAPDREAIARWAKAATFTQLQVVRAERGAADDDQGSVEFIALYREEGQDRVHHERSRFRRRDGRWVYVDAEPLKAGASPKGKR